MLTLKTQVTKYLAENPNSKAKTLASFLGVSRKEINKILYGNLNFFEINEDFEWDIRGPQPLSVSAYAEVSNQTRRDSQDVPSDSIVWDGTQKSVIEMEADRFQVVEAGPGSGKTAIACARVAFLIESEDVEPCNILLISFTRTAIYELKKRISSFASDPLLVQGVQLWTLDSFTWRALYGISDDEHSALTQSFEQNIESLVKKFKDKDQTLLEYIYEFEHVIIDEGQDLVGNRMRLVLELIENLSSDCGITLFADSAQGIYGFTNRQGNEVKSPTTNLISELPKKYEGSYSPSELTNIYRTKDENLKKLFIEGRLRLKSHDMASIEAWKGFKAFIESCAHKKSQRLETDIADCSHSSLVLFRTRGEALFYSSLLWGKKIPHKIRMSGSSPLIHPWIGRLLGQYAEDTIDRVTFVFRWGTLISDEPERAEAAWNCLAEVVGLSAGKIKLARLRELLKREKPPIELIQNDSDSGLHILGTVHASKGRESDVVYFMLPHDSFIDYRHDEYTKNPEEIEEECRVLYVGATRSKMQLITGNAPKIYARQLSSKRIYKSTKDKAAKQVQIGIDGDLDVASFVSQSGSLGPEDIQNLLWRSRPGESFRLNYDKDLKKHRLLSAEHGTIGTLSRSFGYDLLEIGEHISKSSGSKKLYPGYCINHVYLSGISTAVIPETERSKLKTPWCHSGFCLIPVISGFSKVFFK